VRIDVKADAWIDFGQALSTGGQTLVALWADADRVRMGLIDPTTAVRLIATLTCADGRYPSIGQWHAPAIRIERALRDLTGILPEDLPDDRPWLDHGAWPGRLQSSSGAPYAFLPVEGDGLHQIPVGPVHAGIIEPGHFRFTANGETIVRLEERLGYVHKGIASLVQGRSASEAARLVGRMSGDSTVAYAFAFARAVEAALNIEAPPRAVMLRAIMAEIERIAHHVNDFGAICNDASVVALHAHCALLRERILDVSGRLFGHRLMMDCIIPGGVVVDLDDKGADDLRRLIDDCEREFGRAVYHYEESPSIQDRTVATGCVSSELVRRYGAGGFVGRAANRNFDSRRDAAYPPYESLDFAVPVREEGDVNARAWVRVDEVSQSVAMLRQMLDRLPLGDVRVALPVAASGEGAALVEAFRGDVFVSVRLVDGGRLGNCHARDPSWFQWPLLEAAIEGNIVADFPLCNKSFNCSYSGHDM
jgi:Ni,Fe-hydrogenase III large subunit